MGSGADGESRGVLAPTGLAGDHGNEGGNAYLLLDVGLSPWVDSCTTDMGKAGEEQGRGAKKSRVLFESQRASLSAEPAPPRLILNQGNLGANPAVWSAWGISFKCSKEGANAALIF